LDKKFLFYLVLYIFSALYISITHIVLRESPDPSKAASMKKKIKKVSKKARKDKHFQDDWLKNTDFKD